MKKVRKISQNEMIYMDIQEMTNYSLDCQYLIEYQKEINEELLKAGLEKMKLENPMAFVQARKDFWIENSQKILIKELNFDADDLFSSPVFTEKLNVNSNTIAFYILKSEDENYILSRFSHSVFDGKGALIFLEALFAQINEVSFDKLDNSLCDEDFIKDIYVNDKPLPLTNDYHLKNVVVDKHEKIKYEKLVINGYHQGIIAKITKLLSSYFQEEFVKFMIPTDIRRHKTKKKYISNLALPIFLEVSDSETWENINGKLLYSLKNKEELNKQSARCIYYNLMPKFLRKYLLNIVIEYKKRKKSFLIGAIISYLGRAELKTFDMRDNSAIGFVILPVLTPFAPFSFMISEADKKTKIIFAYNENFVPRTTIDDLKFHLKEILK